MQKLILRVNIYFILYLGLNASVSYAKSAPQAYLQPMNQNIVLTNPLNMLSQEDLRVFSKSKVWQKLLYYKGSESEVDSPDFFLSQNGKFNAYTELKHTMDLLKDSTNKWYCTFPARFFVINKNFNLQKLNLLSECEELNEFLKRSLSASVSLVFSSYYVNNPSSAFGHTFLKLNKDTNLDLMNYGINYAATANASSGLIYSLKGLLGFFKGEFTAIPYYYKVREYNDYESRHLWEYELNLDSEKVFLLNLHVWELGQAWSWYYFLTKNCSYWALKIIEAIEPRLDLSNDLSSFFILPSDTLKIISKKKDLVKNIKFRPSLRFQLLEKINSITKRKFKIITKNINSLIKDNQPIDFSTATSEELDLALLYYDYKQSSKILSEEEQILKKKTPLLTARSKLETKIPFTQKDQKVLISAPHTSHPPGRFSLGYNQQSSNNSRVSAIEVRFKLGLHDLLDPAKGYDANMSISYLQFSLQNLLDSNENQNIIFNNFHLLKIEAYNPISDLDSKLSWRFFTGVDSDRFTKSWFQKNGLINFDIGYSLNLNSNKVLFYAFGAQHIEANNRFENLYRYGIGPTLGFKYQLGPNFLILSELNYNFLTSNFSTYEKNLNSTSRFNYFITPIKTSLSYEFNLTRALDRTLYDSSVLVNYYF